jgi:hypothetical protein
VGELLITYVMSVLLHENLNMVSVYSEKLGPWLVILTSPLFLEVHTNVFLKTAIFNCFLDIDKLGMKEVKK